MEATGKVLLMNEKKHEAITNGLEPISGEAGVPAPGNARGRFHNSLGGFPSAAEGAAGEDIAGPLDDGDAIKS